MRILAIGPHPDDIEYGCGGSLILHKNRGDELFLLVLTKGELSSGDKRVSEQESAARFLNAKLFWGGFMDTQIPEGRPVIEKIDQIIQEVNPDIVYVNYPDNTHQDHRNTGVSAMAACRYIKKVLFYEDYTTRNFEPTVFVDISAVLRQKIELLECHHSQVTRKYPTGLNLIESVHAIASYRGFQGKVRYAEAFVPLRYLIEI